MQDIYLYEGTKVLRNKLNIRDEALLDTAEAELSRDNMITLYDCGFSDFSPKGLCEIHRFLFHDLYEWAGQYKIINISKREELLAGMSVWYSNDEDIQQDLQKAWDEIDAIEWNTFTREQFVHNLVHTFPAMWQVHPFREGNTRTIVMMLTFFVEAHGYYLNQQLLREAAGYVRNAFVMASIGKYSEYEHLERILLDAVCESPIYTEDCEQTEKQRSDSYQQYYTAYRPTAHEYRKETTPTEEKYYS